MSVVTIQDMHYDFQLKADKVASLSNFDFNRAEIDWLLNEAQAVLLKRKYGINNIFQTGFEGTQKRIDDLQTLLVKYPEQGEITPTSVDGMIYEIPLSTLSQPYLFFVRGSVEIDGCLRGNMKLIQHDDLNDVLQDPFNNASAASIPFNFGRTSDGTGQGSIYMYPQGFTIDKVRIEYLKQPARMHFGGYTYIDGNTYPQQDCEMPEQVRREIVDEAVSIALGYVEDPSKYQIARAKSSMNE